MYADHRIDLAHRRGDGIDVILWWSPDNDSVAVEVMHLASDVELRARRRPLPCPRRLLPPLRLRGAQPRAARGRSVKTHHRWSLVTARPRLSGSERATDRHRHLPVRGRRGLDAARARARRRVADRARRHPRACCEKRSASANGHEVDSRGDELFAVFVSHAAAADAAIDAQRRLGGHNWPAPVRVRIGLHTGTAALAEDGYVGVDVHRAFRIASAGHGGQIVARRPRAPRSRPAATSATSGSGPCPTCRSPSGSSSSTSPASRRLPASARRPGATPVRVVLADDSVLLREGIARLLQEAGFDVVAQSGNAEDLLRHVAMHKPRRRGRRHPDAADADRRRPAGREGDPREPPETGVLVLSQYVEPGYAMELLSESAEGVGYLLKDRVADIDEFAAAVRRVAEGGSALDPAVVSELVGQTPARRPARRALAARTRGAGVDGRGPLEPGDRGAAVRHLRAVEKHVTSIFVKLRLPAAAEDHRRVLAVLALLRG